MKGVKIEPYVQYGYDAKGGLSGLRIGITDGDEVQVIRMKDWSIEDMFTEAVNKASRLFIAAGIDASHKIKEPE